MGKVLKIQMAGELDNLFRDINTFFVFDYTGMKADTAKELRSEFRKKNISVKVVKTSMANRVLSKNVVGGDLKEFLKGPSALVYGGESPVETAKSLLEWKKSHKNFQIKGGYLSGKKLNLKDIEALSKVPPKEVIFGTLAYSMRASTQNIARLLKATAQNLFYAFFSYSEAMEKSGINTTVKSETTAVAETTVKPETGTVVAETTVKPETGTVVAETTVKPETGTVVAETTVKTETTAVAETTVKTETTAVNGENKEKI